MNTKIIISDIQDITLSTQFIEFEAPNGKVVIDIKKLLSANGDEAYFNATQIAKMFEYTNKKGGFVDGSQILKNYLKLDITKRYMESLEKFLDNNSNSKLLLSKGKIKLKYPKRGFVNENAWLNGTWFYKDLAIDFFRYLDTDFAVICDQFLKQVITQSHILHTEREQTKILFKPLTDTIKNVWRPKQTSDNKKKWAYKMLVDLANLSALGVSSQKYKKDKNIEVEKGKTIRDYMTKNELKRIEEAERKINGIIEFGRVYEYEELKTRLEVR